MYETFDIGRLYFTLLRNPPRWLERAESQEDEPPFRQGHGLALRIWPKLALVVGWWGRGVDEVDEETGRAEATARSRVLEVTTEEIASWGFSDENPNPTPTFQAIQKHERA